MKLKTIMCLSFLVCVNLIAQPEIKVSTRIIMYMVTQ